MALGVGTLRLLFFAVFQRLFDSAECEASFGGGGVLVGLLPLIL